MTDTVEWETTDAGVVPVSASGLATAVSAGFVDITATCEEDGAEKRSSLRLRNK